MLWSLSAFLEASSPSALRKRLRSSVPVGWFAPAAWPRRGLRSSATRSLRHDGPLSFVAPSCADGQRRRLSGELSIPAGAYGGPPVSLRSECPMDGEVIGRLPQIKL